jgi:hypothetical protein
MMFSTAITTPAPHLQVVELANKPEYVPGLLLEDTVQAQQIFSASSASCTTPSGSGTCMSTSSCSGTSIPGYCEGSSDYGVDVSSTITFALRTKLGKLQVRMIKDSIPGIL